MKEFQRKRQEAFSDEIKLINLIFYLGTSGLRGSCQLIPRVAEGLVVQEEKAKEIVV